MTIEKYYKKGYTQGVYDMFHIGHLNLLNAAKKKCDYLVVGINSDSLVEEYKHKQTVIKENDRKEIVANIKSVDKAVIVHTLDKVEVLKEIGFDVIFIGSDWVGNIRWEKTKTDLAKYGVDVVFLQHTDGISSTDLRKVKDNFVDENNSVY